MNESLYIERIVNFPIDSNCYLITSKNSKEGIVVDPALENASAFYEEIISRGLLLKYIILTHEHFDHIISVEYLRKVSSCRVISSLVCSQSIVNPKKNLSLFHDQIGFSCSPSDIIIEHNSYSLTWGTYNLEFFLTPGHSEGSLSFCIGNHLFTGDTIIRDHKTVVKLPGGNIEKLKKSIDLLFNRFEGTTMIYPGHGEIFSLSEISANSLIAAK